MICLWRDCAAEAPFGCSISVFVRKSTFGNQFNCSTGALTTIHHQIDPSVTQHDKYRILPTYRSYEIYASQDFAEKVPTTHNPRMSLGIFLARPNGTQNTFFLRKICCWRIFVTVVAYAIYGGAKSKRMPFPFRIHCSSSIANTSELFILFSLKLPDGILLYI